MSNFILLKTRIITCGILALIFFFNPSSLFGENTNPALNQSFVLRHRLAVVPISSYSKKKPEVSALIKILDPKILFPEEGVIIPIEDWATVIDLTKSEVDKSDFMRLVELPAINEKRGQKSKLFSSLADELDLILLVKYGAAGNKRRVFFRLLEADSGHLITTTDKTSLELSEAVHNALAEIEDHLLTMAWRCRVIAVTNKQMIINRGRVDGLREGVELVGYSIKKQASVDVQEPEELLIMKYGEKKGLYKVIETRNEFSRIVPANEGGQILSIGDILEMPEVRLKERDIKSRGSRVWDKIYNQ